MKSDTIWLPGPLAGVTAQNPYIYLTAVTLLEKEELLVFFCFALLFEIDHCRNRGKQGDPSLLESP